MYCIRREVYIFIFFAKCVVCIVQGMQCVLYTQMTNKISVNNENLNIKSNIYYLLQYITKYRSPNLQKAYIFLKTSYITLTKID